MDQHRFERMVDKLYALADHPSTSRPEAEAALARVAALYARQEVR